MRAIESKEHVLGHVLRLILVREHAMRDAYHAGVLRAEKPLERRRKCRRPARAARRQCQGRNAHPDIEHRGGSACDKSALLPAIVPAELCAAPSKGSPPGGPFARRAALSDTWHRSCAINPCHRGPLAQTARDSNRPQKNIR